ncbi:MAG TPA: adenylate/guanylate cyclase domain-containing protein [Candidatus Limnocylindrales bacterium]|nr:adenylate/guanylate cyclase domain-containing protein [Candidatus Limnocylindrales bacterium]
MRERPLPTGTVTFLFSDIEGSTRLVQQLGPAAYTELLERHNAILRAAFERHGGTDRGTQGDSFLAMFPEAPAAIEAAVEAQRELRATAWPAGAEVRVRMGLHAGLGTLGGDDYVGIDVHRAARIAAAAHGGQIVVSEATRGLVEGQTRPDVHLLALGEHELRDLGRVEPLYQVVADGLDSAFPPLNAPGPTRLGNLPSRLTTFIGRESELDELAHLMDVNRLITLVGPGGTGKTSLAVELLRRQAGRFADGTWFVALESVNDPGLVPSVLASTFGLVSGSPETMDSRLRAFLGPRTLGVIVDNVEQVIAAAPLLPELLRAAPGLTIVATSRAPLRVAGEQEYPVQPMPVPGIGDPVAQVIANDAIRLFADRAERVRPGYRLVSEDVDAVAEICRRLDCLPLGIEIAASRMALLPARDIAERLGRRLDLPGAGSRDAPERQRTLQGAIGWSYDLLGEPQQRLLERLSVFAGHFAVDQAEAVCGPAQELRIEVLDGLSALVEHSLVQPVAVSLSGARFRLLTTVQMFAAERLAARGDAEAIRHRHAETYLAIAEQIAPTVLGHDQARRLDRLALEHDNFRAAFDWAIDRGDTQIAMRLASALWRYWQGRGHLEEGWATVSRILAMPAADEPSAARLGVLDAAGGVAWWQGDIPRADRMYEQQVAEARGLGDPGAIALALFNRSHTLAAGQGSPESVALRAEAGTLFEQVGDARGAARVRWANANLLMLRDAAAAADELAELMRVYEELDDVYYFAMAAGSLSWSLLETGNLDRSLEYALLSFRVATQGGDVAAAMVSVRQLEIHLHLLGLVREAAILDGAADMLSNRYGVTTPPVFAENVLRRWPGSAELRDAVEPDEFDRLRRIGAGMSVDELADMIEATFAARQAGRPTPAPTGPSSTGRP